MTDQEKDLLRACCKDDTTYQNALALVSRSIESKMPYKDSVITIDAWSGKIKHEGRWIRVEEYLLAKFGIKSTHGISEESAKRFSTDNFLPNM